MALPLSFVLSQQNGAGPSSPLIGLRGLSSTPSFTREREALSRGEEFITSPTSAMLRPTCGGESVDDAVLEVAEGEDALGASSCTRERHEGQDEL